MKPLRLLGIGLLVTSAAVGNAQTSPEQNLQSCLSGRYPALCDHSALTAEQLKQVQNAGNRENLKVCMTGRYPALCNHAKLTPDQSASVKEAEKLENLRVCSEGRYPALCNHGMLSPDELGRVRRAEESENLRTCMDGRFSATCNHSLLTPEQAKAMATAEAAASARTTLPAAGRVHGRQSGDCKSGLSIESVEGDGKIIKIDDGSMWEVDDVDTVDTALWMAVDDVVLCNGKIINTDENESAEVTQLSGGAFGGGEASASSRSGYAIEASANDETFVINGELFKAKTYCFNFDKGDRVKFVQGSPLGACVSATLLNLRSGKVCEVWCE